MGQMDGMVAIVTGASRGLGKAIAVEYAREGASLVICARGQSPTGLPGTLQETVQEIHDGGGEVLGVNCDVTDEAQVEEMVRQARERFGRIDVLFNNAGTMVLGESILEIEPARWDQLIRINVGGPYRCSRAVLPVMMEQGKGSIINIGSRMATDPAQGGGVLYSASKAAVHMFSLCLADEVKDYNIAVNILSPGAMRSEGSAAIPWTQRDWHERVDPSAVGPCAVFLALQDASTYTGQLAARADFGTTWGPGIG
ncbi:MAG: SDR family NAD(P)-dependent oxidoreductase [Chloroflexota bacterium]|nr:SDR family NAD(P)-dependent oxidoreductase [Chloroflexota bacterium]